MTARRVIQQHKIAQHRLTERAAAGKKLAKIVLNGRIAA
jgi:hypothetical protein